MQKVYISATFLDLMEHRQAVAHALTASNMDVHTMERYVASDERTVQRCLDDVQSCSVYIGILARRYGWIPPGFACSITELEYRQAKAQPAKTRCLIFLLHDDAPWPPEWTDALTNPASAAKLTAFKSQLADSTTASFRSIDELVQAVITAIQTP